MAPYRNLFNLWLSYVAAMVVLGWVLSAASSYDMMGYASVIVILVLAYMGKRSWRNVSSEEKSNLKNDLIFWPFLLLLVLISLAGSLYTTAVLDSLSYRIPRLLMWLQEGGIHYIDNPDDRLNFMTPVWEFASTPLYQLARFRLLWLGSGISWVLLYLAFIFLSRKLGADPKTSRWLAIIPSASVGFVLQAASTMNDIWATALIAMSLSFILMFEEKRESRDILSSGLALALAAGAKPHFAVLALPWILWCIFSKSKPLSCINWNKALLVGLLALLCSPLPTFITNHIHYGSIKGPAGEGGFALGPWWMNILLGTVMMLWQLLQPPLNPIARQLEAWNQSWIESLGLNELAPRFKLNARELSMVDSASLGFLVTLILICGFFMVIRNRKSYPNCIWLAALAGLTGYLIAVSQVVPGTLGRSFLGFTILCVPLGLAGFQMLPEKIIKLSGLLAAAGAAASLVMSPSHPLWPAKTIATAKPSSAAIISKYLEIHQRPWAGYSLVKQLPLNVEEIGVLAISDQSLIQLWGDPRHPLKVKFYPKDITLNRIHDAGPDYHFLIGRTEPDTGSLYSELSAKFAKDPRFVQVASARFTSKIQRGPETWYIYKRLKP